jgi:uncharacterized damage-inducible protein DinB
MLGHDSWATGQILKHASMLSDELLDTVFDVGHGTLRDTLSHHTEAIAFWTAQMTGQEIPESGPQAGASVSGITERFEDHHAAFTVRTRELRDEGRLEETFNDHNGHPISYAATILHVLHHSAQHRAEEAHMLHRLGVSEVWDYDPQEWEWSLRLA